MKIYIINLTRAVERRERMKKAFALSLWPLEFCDAIDGKLLSDQDLCGLANEGSIYKRYKRMLSPGEVACSASHRTAMGRLLASGESSAIILEDDVVPIPEFYEIVSELESLGLRRTVVKLDTFCTKATTVAIRHRRALGKGFRLLKPVFSQWDARAYWLDRRAASSILKCFPNVSYLADDWGTLGRVVRMRYITPPLALDDESSESQLAAERTMTPSDSRRISVAERILIHIFFLLKKYALILFS